MVGCTMTPSEKLDLAGDALGLCASEAAVRGAKAYLQAHELHADTPTLAQAIREACLSAIPRALKDLEEAIDCGMAEVGFTTFRASMALAGVQAAKLVGVRRS